MRKLFFVSAVCAVLIFNTWTAFALPVHMASLADYSLTELMNLRVVTPTKTPMPLSRAPASITIVTGDEIRDRGYETLLDLLEDLPGVDIFRYNNEENGSQVTLRGNTGNNKFIILSDGVTISAATGEQIPLAYNYPLYLADRVEIIFGPGSALFGADAFSGVINIITEPENREEAFAFNMTGGTDAFNMGYVTARTNLGDNLWLTFGGHLQSADNPDLAAAYPDEFAPTAKEAFGQVIIPQDQVTDSYSGATTSETFHLAFDIDNQFTLGLRNSIEKHPTSNGVQPQATTFGDQARWETQMRNVYGKYRFDNTDGLSGETLISYSQYEVLPQSGYQNMFVNFERRYKYSRDSGFTAEQQLNYTVDNIHALTGGLVYENLYSLPKSADMEKAFNPDEPASTQGLVHPGTTHPLDIQEVTYQNYGVYLQMLSSWNEKLSTTFGLRFDENSRYGPSVNPRGGVVFAPTSKATIKLLYGESYLAPSPKVSYGVFGSFFESPDSPGTYESWFYHIPNQNLKPEKARYYELNGSLQVSPEFLIILSTNYTIVDDIIVAKFSNEDIKFAGATVHAWEQNRNSGSATIYGGDMTFKYKTSLQGGDSLTLWSGYTYTNGDIDEGGGVNAELPYIVRHKVKGGATWRRGKYSITPRFYFIGEQTHKATEQNDPSKRLKVDGYTVVHLTITADDLFHKGISLSLNIRNLFDTRYYHAGGNSAPAASFVASPQDPRTVKLGIGYRF